LTRCERSGQNSRIIGVILITESSKYRALRREVVEKCLGFRDLPPSLLYAKAGSQDCPSRKVQIGSVSSKP
jgi:hypothetical protein